MGRMKYSEEERNTIVMKFLQCTKEIIYSEGIDQVSIRKVAARAGFNSATMYLYFSGSDELITLACMSYLEDYCRMLVTEIAHMKTVYAAYMQAWDVFSQHAFRNPQVFERLFFYPHSQPLKDTAARYYQIYPELLKQSEGIMRDTLLAGTLSARNVKMLRVLCRDELHIAEPYVEIINDLTVCYFKKLLDAMPENADEAAVQQQSEQLHRTLDYLFFGQQDSDPA